MKIIRYNKDLQQTWNSFLELAKNATFLFNRDYIDYHHDRFEDCSLMIYDGSDTPIALLPGNIKGDTFYSHQGLTYGGVIMNRKCTSGKVLDIFDAIHTFLRELGVKHVTYKPIPYIYHDIPAQEDLYAIFRTGKNLQIAVRNISATLYMNDRIKFIESRKSGIRKAKRAGLEVREDTDLSGFWKVLEENLMQRYDAKPVHTLTEMQLLQSRFPDKIRLFVTKRGEEILGGAILLMTKRVCHTQYISASLEGKEYGALDLLFDYILNEMHLEQPVFDFGTSNENGGKILNESLIFQKEGFGGRGVVYDTYTYDI